MKIKVAIASLLAALSLSTSAMADTVNAGVLPVAPANPFSHVFSHGPGAFFDTVNFDVIAPQVGSSANPLVLTLGGIDVYNITGLSYQLWDNYHPAGLISYGVFNGDNTTNITLLAPGSYHIDITGTADGVAGGVYGVALISAVPEAETYAMLIAGLGCLVFVKRRQRNKIEVDSSTFA
ncbi:FxDxF family PEP-CTERM protein [Massilia endophytica]|uniref:FxDxF family PEP-CTERM protein n=1 Tax=Massilia endophytica TaxID=2899220 RepID=UPI001E3FE386|nr:FxDxF family PEP-CTERM protein [Massilia endophytica]UGQ48564.1 FxDxF family PEP-CTERM protein [Massilia endophytica]